MKLDLQILQQLIEHNYAFAFWHCPNADTIDSIYCNESEVTKCTKLNNGTIGFVFAPFETSTNSPIYVLPFKKEKPIQKQTTSSFCRHAADTTCDNHNSYIEKLETLLHNIDEETPKVVLSRRYWDSQFNIQLLPNLFKKLIETQPTTFTYLIHIPEQGCWMGASPELLFASNNNVSNIMVLAGTQPAENICWQKKEQDEHLWVKKHVCSILNSMGIRYQQSATYTATTGSLAHLRTDICFESSLIKNQIGDFVSKLHPTPAICGLPVDKAKNLINKIENYDRKYYSGFVGPITNNTTSLYVNIRCLQAFSNGAMLYAGGGITADSNTENEWCETELKLNNLLRLIKK